MTKKDFEVIAKVINDLRLADDIPTRPVSWLTLDILSEAMADRFKEINPRFNRDIFLRATGNPFTPDGVLIKEEWKI